LTNVLAYIRVSLSSISLLLLAFIIYYEKIISQH
jgi:hypothetical protein